jgi:homoserine dehydrogenase
MPPKQVFIAVVGTYAAVFVDTYACSLGVRLSLTQTGLGGVGKAFLAQLETLTTRLAATTSLRLVLVARSAAVLYDPTYAGLSFGGLEASLAASRQEMLSVGAMADLLAAAPGPAVFIDNTSSQDVADAYPALLSAGISVVTPNKKAFSGSAQLFSSIWAAAAAGGAHVRHESSVGAGLPIISTLNDLIATGDEVERIVGVFSGTMSFLLNAFSPVAGAGGRWSDAVRRAKALGYTEPDPRDDLNGLDVARKLTILARLVGLDVASPAAFAIESLIPAELAACASADDFLARLPDFDERMAERRDAAAAAGRVLRFVGQVDVRRRALRVGLESFERAHPIAGLTGSDNIISFHTRRYGAAPLIVQGAGAGADVTAMGVSADLVRVVESQRQSLSQSQSQSQRP